MYKPNPLPLDVKADPILIKYISDELARIGRESQAPTVEAIQFIPHFVDADFSRDIENTVAAFDSSGSTLREGLYEFNGGVWTKL